MMNMNKNINKTVKFLLIIGMVMIFGFRAEPDDKELFMGENVNASQVKANVMILMDSSGSMNTVVFYPEKGPDGILNTADDGYDSKETYSGSVDGFVMDDNTKLSESDWYARWIVPDDNDSSVKNAVNLDRNDLGGAGNPWSGDFWTGCYEGDGTGINFRCGTNGANYFRAGDKILYRQTISPYNTAVATLKRKFTGADGSTWFELEDIKGETIIPHDNNPNDVNDNGYKKGHFQQAPTGQDWHPAIVKLYGYRDVWGSQTQYEDVRYPPNYVKWMFIHAADEQRDRVIYFSNYGAYKYEDTNDHTVPPTDWNGPSTCDQGNGQRIKQMWTRIQVAREVLCQVARNSNEIVQLGLAEFSGDGYNTDPAGGDIVEGLGDMSDLNSLQDFKTKIWSIEANTWTPLAESLADVWYYYKPGPNSKTYWPVDMELLDGTISTSNAVSDIDYWCQNNFVIVMTDGESQKDAFDHTKYNDSIFTSSDHPVKRESAWNDWTDGWGDTDNNEKDNGHPENYDPDTSTYCPDYSCWRLQDNRKGTDYLDDVAYFLRHQDMFPDEDHTLNPDSKLFSNDPVDGWPGVQNIFTYVIGFAIDNDMLRQTAVNGDGAYYTADNYNELVTAFQNVITSINLRSFAFSSITAPKKTTTATNDELTLSYVGYFLPSQAASIWEGHLLAYKLEDAWGFDADNSGEVEDHEYIYEDAEACLGVSGDEECYRRVSLSLGHEWDVADHIPNPPNRNLYTYDLNNSTNIPFTLANKMTFKPTFGPTVSENDAEAIINKIRQKQLGDVFHSDVGFVGPPVYGKKYVTNINPTTANAQTYEEFQSANKDRRRVLYVGTNDGIFHMFYADGQDAGKEVWGFIPDEVLPSLKTIVLDNQHTYTVDGRMSAADIYYQRSGCTGSYATCWSTILVFGLRQGGNAYYALDITTLGSHPSVLWKFKESTYSGESWGNPAMGKIRLVDPTDSTKTIDKWVAILTGGFAFNSENSADLEGKAVFVVDASNGNLIWMLGYVPPAGDGGATIDDTGLVPVSTSDNIKYLTNVDQFNFPTPSALTAVDKDNNGYLDAIYFGNVGGHFFKTDISDLDTDNWTTNILFNKYITNKVSTHIDTIEGSVFTVHTKTGFDIGDTVTQFEPYATGYITEIDNKDFTVTTMAGTFQTHKDFVVRTYDPIYHAPALAYDTCYQLWVTFGTGDRDRPRSNPNKGRFIGFKDGGNNAIHHINDGASDTDATTLQQLNAQLWGVNDTETVNNPSGWYFDFPDTAEKIFDPAPVVLPGENLVPHIFFNSYQPPASSVAHGDNPCDAPQEGIMHIYDIALVNCGTLDEIEGSRQLGRIAGGGIYHGGEIVTYTSETGKVADVPGEEGGQFKTKLTGIGAIGGIIFWVETKR